MAFEASLRRHNTTLIGITRNSVAPACDNHDKGYAKI